MHIFKLPHFTPDSKLISILSIENNFYFYLKEEARSTIRRALDECDFGLTECVVRVNSVTSGLMEDDLGEVLGAKRMPDTLMLPKVERPQDIDMV